ncbi:MAG: CoA transferase [Hyphomonadaceae bacterium]|nr:CoA transferase [Hyphomonadaceae bacterium]
MKGALAFVDMMAREIAARTARLGKRVTLDAGVLDRSDSIALESPGEWSPNRSCRMIEARDGWIAANLPREDDLQSVPALLEREIAGDAWEALIEGACELTCAELVARAQVLSLAIAQVGETPAPTAPCVVDIADGAALRERLRVVDFSSLWAGPLCGAVFAAMGADVVKLDSAERLDPTPVTTPTLDRRLNGLKRKVTLPLAMREGRTKLLEEIARADVLITSARARALEGLGITRALLREGVIWIAVTGHGFASARVAFGDDAAASGGLVAWNDDAPRFIGDALADPLTGLAAANVALTLLEQGRGGFVDAALARSAAYVAAIQP